MMLEQKDLWPVSDMSSTIYDDHLNSQLVGEVFSWEPQTRTKKHGGLFGYKKEGRRNGTNYCRVMKGDRGRDWED